MHYNVISFAMSCFETRRLLTELDSYKPEAGKPGDKAAKPGGGGDTNHVTYQLYYRPEQAKFSHNARVHLLYIYFHMIDIGGSYEINPF